MLADLPELAALDSARDLIRIPEEQNVPLTSRVRAIVDTTAFQRLRHVSQLGLVAHVYPGATHTRFEHTLGVYFGALRYLQQLRKDARFVELVDQHHASLLIAAALLHDIGHWPFCHPIEDLGLPGLTKHEEAARDILHGDEVGNVLRDHWGLEPDEVLAVLEHRVATPAGKVIGSILSGPIDIDKMDYLERDSLHAGVPYGRNFDKQRLIQSLVLNESGDGLAITSKGRTAAELMVFARYVMFCEVYWHHAVRSSTCMLTRAFLDLKDRFPLSKLLTMRDAEFVAEIRKVAQGTECETLVEGSLGERRALYKRAAEFRRDQWPNLYDRMASLDSRELADVSARLADYVAGQTGAPVQRLDVLIDVPSQRREIEFNIDVQFTKQNRWQKLHEVSPVVDSLAARQFTDAVKLMRVFVNPAVLREIGRDFDWPDAIDRLLHAAG